MYEIKITAASVNELRGRVLALAAQMTLEANAAPAPVAATPEPVAAAPVVAAPEPVAAAPEDTLATEPLSDAPEPHGADPIPYIDVRTAMLQVAVMCGRESVDEILAHFGAIRKASEIDPSRFGEVLAMAKLKLGAV
jgi:hypothetical protein